MCGCRNSPVLAPMSVNKTPKQQVLEATDCNVTEQQLIELKQVLVENRTPENTQSVNQYIGFIDTMLNYQQYCMYSLNTISI